jgi:hypothetical protein
MYYRKRNSPLKGIFIFILIILTICQGFIWFANQGEIVIANQQTQKFRMELDSIRFTMQSKEDRIKSLMDIIEDLHKMDSLKKKEIQRQNRINAKLSLITDSIKENTIIKTSINE